MNHIKEYLKDRRIMIPVLIVIALALLDVHYGIHFGIEFVGGTQIPITLEHPVNVTAMSALISSLQQRISTFGLKQITIEGVGDSHVYATIPTVSSTEVNQTINIIESQGRFDGIVNGREAVNGSSILHGSIGVVPPQKANNTVTYAVTFYITQEASKHFAQVVLGAANRPLYMFLDRPTSALILINYSQLGNVSSGVSAHEALSAMQGALQFGSKTIPVISVSTSNSSIASAESFLNSSVGKYKQAFISSNLPASLIEYARSQNFSVTLVTAQNMTPSYTQISANQSVLESWPLVGLLTSPVLSPSITNGNASQSYQISGAAPANLPTSEKMSYATVQSKTVASILSGGALPVAIIVGTPTTIPPTLGSHFLFISAIAGIASVLFVSLFIVIKYRRMFLIAPILLTTLMELFIIVSIIGLVGTMDLSAVAGMIAVVGTGVDAQVIITDEVLSKTSDNVSTKTLMGHAFYTIWVDAILLVVAMLPLFFSTSLVTVIGFAESTIIGALLGVLITRPAYSAIISRHYS